VFQQQPQVGPCPIEGVERTNTVMMWPQQRIGFAQRNLYAMNVDRRENGNCYNCRGFRHLARNYKNRRAENRIGEERKLEYGGSENNGQRKMEERNEQSNLNREGDLIVFN